MLEDSKKRTSKFMSSEEPNQEDTEKIIAQLIGGEEPVKDNTRLLLEYIKLHDRIKVIEEKKQKIYIQLKDLALSGKLKYNQDKVSAELVTSFVRLRWKDVAKNSMSEKDFNELENKKREECTNLRITKIVEKGEFQPKLVQ